MSIFPSSPSIGDEYSGYRWDGTAWTVIGLDLNVDYAPLSSFESHTSASTTVHSLSDTGDVVYDNDSRLTDSRTPTSHASSHASGGSDAITIAQSQVTNLSTDLAAKLGVSGGKILQIVRATDSTSRTTSSTSYVDAGISVTITPQKSDSAIIVIWSARVAHDGNADLLFQAITDASNNSISGAQDVVVGSTTTVDFRSHNTIIGYSTPATTSATTYKGRFRVLTLGNGKLLNDSTTGQLYAIEVSA